MFSGSVGDVLPAMPVHSLDPIHSTTPLSSLDAETAAEKSDLTRSASFSYLSSLSRDVVHQGIKRTFSENVLSLPRDRKSSVNSNIHSVNVELLRRASRKAKKKISGARFTLSTEDEDREPPSRRRSSPENEEVSKSLGRSVAGTIRNIARKSWISTSRPSSPARKDDDPIEKKRSWSPSKSKIASAASTISVPEPAVSRPSSPSSPREDDLGLDERPTTRRVPQQGPQATPLQRPPNALSLKSKSEVSLKRLSRTSSATSLKSQFSAERSHSRLSLAKVPPLPKSISSDHLSGLNVDIYKRRDPLWTPFRTIESEFTIFQSKTSLQKAKVLRTSLLPFLSKYAHHPSNKSLRAEDLDRRVAILNKWWTGLLEMLNGRNNQSIMGTDRPAFLEAATTIMIRPEWRIPGFPSATTPTDTPRPASISKSKSSYSLESDETDFLIDTIHQNVRTIFVQNLLSQMTFVVERLSMRSAPASLVTFSGKACAYAFFFCPGVADMLVRLWRLPSGTLRRVFAELGVHRGDKLDLISKDVVSAFPPPVRSLSITSQAALSRHLQRTGQVPPGTEHVHWHGPWVSRWCGRDTDLLFVFTKHFHLLLSEFLPSEFPLKDRFCIPGLVPLYSQVLVVLETTLYRQAGQSAVENYAAAAAAAGNMANPDATASLPMTIANASRSIAENRLIMLLRDMLADRTLEHSTMRELFVTTFDSTIKAAVERISVYNNDACFVLCDFMEEVLPITFRYHQTAANTHVLDWPFWLQVCRRMMESQNTLTQIRLIAFVYSTWSILISNEQRKRNLVLDWLLDPTVFNQHFCHWSPMVRHYFYRLLCWRVARYDGETSALDLEILQTLAARLNKCWAHYQYLSAEAEMREACPPSSAPCSPAPSRSLIIIRTDSQPVLASSCSSFDRFLPPVLVNQNTPYQNHSSILNTIPAADSPIPTKKRWSLLRSINPFGASPGNNRPGEVTPPGSPDDKPSLLSNDGVPGPNSAIPPAKPMSRPVTPPHQTFSFKFSLEWVESRPHLGNKNRRLTAPLLPANAQRIVEQHRLSSESGESMRSAGGASATRSRMPEVKPLKPKDGEISTARYSGRALAEWSQVLTECRNFYTRRKQEGVPRDTLVETPTIGVETFRLAG